MKRKLYIISISLLVIFSITVGYLFMVVDDLSEAGRIRNIWNHNDTTMRGDTMFIYMETTKANYEGYSDREAFRKAILDHGCVTELPS